MVIRPIVSGFHLDMHKVPVFADHLMLAQRFEHPFSQELGLTGFGLVTCLEGEAQFIINDQRLQLNTSSFAVINRGSRLVINVDETPARPVLLFFRSILADVVAAEIFHRRSGHDKELSYAELKDYRLTEYVHYTHASVKEVLEQAMQLSQSCASFQALKTDALLRSLLQSLGQENYEAIAVSARLPVVKQSTRVDLYKRLSHTKSWMDEHLTEDISLDDYADMALMNPAHFLRNFKTAFGITPHQYMMEKRLELAKKLLLNTRQSVQEISEQIGFDVLSSFSYQFKKQEGLSPSQFRKQVMTD